jgi:hypothetical protein
MRISSTCSQLPFCSGSHHASRRLKAKFQIVLTKSDLVDRPDLGRRCALLYEVCLTLFFFFFVS